jgi:hypothetical protein
MAVPPASTRDSGLAARLGRTAAEFLARERSTYVDRVPAVALALVCLTVADTLVLWVLGPLWPALAQVLGRIPPGLRKVAFGGPPALALLAAAYLPVWLGCWRRNRVPPQGSRVRS